MMARVKKLLTWLLAMAATVYFVMSVLMFLFQKDLIFYPASLPANHVYEFDIFFEEQSLVRPDGVTIAGLYFPLEDAVGTVIFYNGNAGHAGQHQHFVRQLQALGQRVYIFDHRSFGKSGGDLEAIAMLGDVLAVHDHVGSRHQDGPIHVIGYSLGSVMATHISANREVASVTLFAPPHSILDMAERRYMPVFEFLITFPFNNEVALQETGEPVLVFHGTSDRVVPIESGRRLKPALKPGDSFIELDGSTHGDVREPEIVWEKMKAHLVRKQY